MQIEDFQKMFAQRLVRWSEHGASRMEQRGLTRADVYQCIMTGEIIEAYDDDYPAPSALIMGMTLSGAICHVVCGLSTSFAHVITAYYPSLMKFEADLKTRRKS